MTTFHLISTYKKEYLVNFRMSLFILPPMLKYGRPIWFQRTTLTISPVIIHADLNNNTVHSTTD